MRLAGKVALITGAGAGIGRASVVLFAREGARVAAVDRDVPTGEETVALAQAAGGEAVFIQADVARAADVKAAIEATVARFGALHVLFNNAGIVLGGTAESTDEEAWDQTMRVNLKSVYLGCRYALPQMRRQGGGVIVNTASVAGLVGVKERAAYSASKMGIIGLTRSIAMDYVGEKIRANCLCPGTVDTPSLQDRIAATGDAETARAAFIARQPMGRLGTAEEIAALALYLASDESAYMTGSAVVIDGGLSL
jgi:meso-butanediol dehydrogenase / (S,S)-butanediol dehydrogenase / diacetyl reductase